MSTTWEGDGRLFDEDNGIATVPAFDYALVKLKNADGKVDNNKTIQAAGLALYLHSLEEHTKYRSMVTHLRQHKLYWKPISDYSLKESDFSAIENVVSFLRDGQPLEPKALSELVENKNGSLQWKEPHAKDAKSFMHTFYPYGYMDEHRAQYFQYVVQEYSEHAQGFDKKIANDTVEEILQGDMAKDRGLHYLGLMAYASLDKNVKIVADLDDVKLFIKDQNEQYQKAKHQEDVRKLNEENNMKIGCFGFALVGVLGACYMLYECSSDKKTDELKDEAKNVVEPAAKPDSIVNDTVYHVKPTQPKPKML